MSQDKIWHSLCDKCVRAINEQKEFDQCRSNDGGITMIKFPEIGEPEGANGQVVGFRPIRIVNCPNRITH